jgi:hypothetical protein
VKAIVKDSHGSTSCGDEPYKAHFRGVDHPTFDYQIFPNRRLARLRGQVTLAAGTLKDWVKLGVAAVKS